MVVNNNMKFKDVRIEPYMRHWMCENCGGEMISTGEGTRFFDQQWKHECDGCGKQDVTDMIYPRIVHFSVSVKNKEIK
jgi:predicted RNA-binding Zn-ribbon protein involved in translation (DUF1610 family)